MDKVLIGIGAYMLWLAANDQAGDAIRTGNNLINIPGFLGMIVIFAVLLSVSQYAPKYAWIASSMGVIIALGFWSKK